MFLGYRHFDKQKKVKPLFPFGHGLSYTTFKYAKLAITPDTMEGDGSVTVSFDVTNTGSREGAEVAQVYVGEKKAKTGEQIAVLAYFLYDQDGHDVHEVTLAVPREDAEAGDALVQDFLHHAQFIDAVAPQRQSE